MNSKTEMTNYICLCDIIETDEIACGYNIESVYINIHHISYITPVRDLYSKIKSYIHMDNGDVICSDIKTEVLLKQIDIQSVLG